MHKKISKKAMIYVIAFVLIFTALIPISSSIYIRKTINEPDYWALIFAVGIYYNHPEQDRPGMLTAAANLYDVLKSSSNWKQENIRKITAEAATGQRLLKELNWLIQNADNDDYVLVFIATHGNNLQRNGRPLDIPPKDEADGSDESLAMYYGFDVWYGFIWDDLLNFYLSRIKAKGLCLIVESCHSGGFNDPPYFSKSIFNNNKKESFVKGLAYELSAKDRIVLMSCKENEVCYGSFFSKFLAEGLWGSADNQGNNNGINSAEEGFDYAKYWVKECCFFTPTILDLYPGDFPLTTH
jgi:hypothetical protein